MSLLVKCVHGDRVRSGFMRTQGFMRFNPGGLSGAWTGFFAGLERWGNCASRKGFEFALVYFVVDYRDGRGCPVPGETNRCNRIGIVATAVRFCGLPRGLTVRLPST